VKSTKNRTSSKPGRDRPSEYVRTASAAYMRMRALSMATTTGALRGLGCIQLAARNWGRNHPPNRMAGSRPTNALEPPSVRIKTESTILGWVMLIPTRVETPLTMPRK
jgi:hypothetical protein